VEGRRCRAAPPAPPVTRTASPGTSSGGPPGPASPPPVSHSLLTPPPVLGLPLHYSITSGGSPEAQRHMRNSPGVYSLHSGTHGSPVYVQSRDEHLKAVSSHQNFLYMSEGWWRVSLSPGSSHAWIQAPWQLFLKEVRSCPPKPVSPVDCAWGDWEASACSKAIGGEKTSKREVVVNHTKYGNPCEGEPIKTEPCDRPAGDI